MIEKMIFGFREKLIGRSTAIKDDVLERYNKHFNL